LRKLLICALALGGFAASAQAADLDLGSMKDPLPDTLSFKGVTIYGALDLGYAYQTHGNTISGAAGAPLNYFMTATNNKAQSTIAANALTQSYIGVKAEEAIGMGWTALAKIETGFVPTSGELADGCASLARNNNKDIFHVDSKGDSSRCGQLFNGPVYVGVSNAAYGTLTVGRQNSLNLDLIAAYDPQALSYAMSLIGFFGGAAAGSGDTEDGRWDNSLKYVYQYGPVHASFMYGQGGQDTSSHGPSIAGSAGFTWRGLSVDGAYTKENSVIASSSFAATPANPTPTPGGFPINKSLSGTISDNTNWTVGAKYTFDLAGWGGWKDGGCGLKDDCPGAKFTVFGGYSRTEFADPTDVVNAGDTTIGGYIIAKANNTNFITDKIQQVAWVGAKYETGPWSFTGAYYHEEINNFLTTATPNGGSAGTHNCAEVTAINAGLKAAGKFLGATTGSNCAGNLDAGSFLVDYAFNKHFDLYAGAQYDVFDGGLHSGALQDNNFLVVTGMRLRF
jgi:predicted porin